MLYNKYRFKNFSDIIGNKEIISILQNILQNTEDSPQVYIFYGESGTGKTSIARVFAKAMQCLSDTDKPCLKCTNCLNTNLLERDGANKSIEDIREIIEYSSFIPLQGKYNFFLIDECHQLSSASWSALLKILEETPSSSRFILTTNMFNKIPTTIKSRALNLYLKIPEQEEIKIFISNILEKENINMNEEVKQTLSYFKNMRYILTTIDMLKFIDTDKQIDYLTENGIISGNFIENILGNNIKITSVLNYLNKINDYNMALSIIKSYIYDKLNKHYTDKLLKIYSIILNLEYNWIEVTKHNFEDSIIQIYLLNENKKDLHASIIHRLFKNGYEKVVIEYKNNIDKIHILNENTISLSNNYEFASKVNIILNEIKILI